MKRWATIIITLLCTTTINAQEGSATDIVTRILEEMTEDGTLTEDYENEAAELISIASDKIDLNTATTEQINKLFFLSEKQKEIIINHREKYGPYRNEVELITLPYFSISDVERILYFVSVGKSNEEKIKAHTAQLNIVARTERTYPKMRGFKAKNDTTPATFIGNEYKKLIRINGNIGKYINCGLVAESDAGEPTFSNGISTTDFLSGFISYNQHKKFVKKIIAGHYSARMGQGLGLWTGFSPDASSFQSSIMRSATGLSENMSASESGYMRGLAITLGNSKITSNIYFSHTDNDVSIINSIDTIDAETFATTIQTNGYHRTLSELTKRNNFQQIIFGAYLRYTKMNLNIGTGFNQWNGSMPIGNKGELYKLYYPTSKNIGTSHADYRYAYKAIMLYGEIAYQSVNAIAAMQGIDIDMGNGNSLTIAGRYFSKRYYTLYQNPFSISSSPGGEKGLYIGLLVTPFPYTSINANINTYKNSWLKYQKFAPTNGYKGRITITHNFSRNNVLSVRLRIDDRDEASNEYSKQIERGRRTSIKLQYNHIYNNCITFKTIAEKIKFNQKNEHSNGFWISEEIATKLIKEKFKFTIQLAHFDAENYDSRIYATQPEILYSMQMPSYIGKGVLQIAQIYYSPIKMIDIWFWCRHVKYFDKNTIGSGHNQIDSSDKTDIKLQTRIKLRYWKRRN